MWKEHDWSKCQSSNICGAFWMNQVRMLPSVVGRSRMEGKLRGCQYLVNARGLQLGYAKVLHEGWLVSVLLYGAETMIWRETERSRNRAAKMETSGLC